MHCNLPSADAPLYNSSYARSPGRCRCRMNGGHPACNSLHLPKPADKVIRNISADCAPGARRRHRATDDFLATNLAFLNSSRTLPVELALPHHRTATPPCLCAGGTYTYLGGDRFRQPGMLTLLSTNGVRARQTTLPTARKEAADFRTLPAYLAPSATCRVHSGRKISLSVLQHITTRLGGFAAARGRALALCHSAKGRHILPAATRGKAGTLTGWRANYGPPGGWPS